MFDYSKTLRIEENIAGKCFRKNIFYILHVDTVFWIKTTKLAQTMSQGTGNSIQYLSGDLKLVPVWPEFE